MRSSAHLALCWARHKQEEWGQRKQQVRKHLGRGHSMVCPARVVAGGQQGQIKAVQVVESQLWENRRTKRVPQFWEPLIHRGCGLKGLAQWGWWLRFQEQQGNGSQGATGSRKLPKQLLTHGGAELTAPTSEGTAMPLSVCITQTQSHQPP